MGSSLSQKLITAGLSMAVGFVAGKVAELGWKAVTGQTAPQDDDGTASLVSVVAFAAVSAAIAAVAQRGVVNKTNKWFVPVVAASQILTDIEQRAIGN